MPFRPLQQNPTAFRPLSQPDPNTDPYGHMQSQIQTQSPVNSFIKHPGIADFIKTGKINGVDSPQPGVLNNLPGVAGTGLANYGKNVFNQYQDSIKNIAQNKADQYSGKESGLEANLVTGAELVKSIFAPITEAIKPSLEAGAEALSNNKTFSDFANGKAGDAVSKAQEAFQQLAKAHPTAAKNFENAFTIAMGVAGGAEGDSVTSSLADTAKGALDTVKTSAGKLADNLIPNLESEAPKINVVKNELKSNELAGKISQGEIKDIPKVKNALSDINLEEVNNAPQGKKYQALKNALDTKIKGLAETRGNSLSSDKGVYNLSDLAIKVGDTTHNYVSDALNQLRTFYSKVNDVSGQSKIDALIKKANDKGLSVKELDDIAVQHGQDLNGFNANGELASGLSKQAAENTRKGVKSTARQLFGDTAYDAVDSHLSDTIRTRDLINHVSEKVNQLSNKIQQRTWLAKAGYNAGKLIDLATGGFVKGLVNHYIPRGEGLKTLNPLDLDKALGKNLTQLQGLVDAKTQTEFTTRLGQIEKENALKPDDIPKGTTTVSKIEPADLSRKPLSKLIKVNNYQSEFAKYLTPDQIKVATKMVEQIANKGKTIDMKSIDSIVKKVKDMRDIIPPKLKPNYRPY